MGTIWLVINLVVVGIIVVFILGIYDSIRKAWQESTSISDFRQRVSEIFHP